MKLGLDLHGCADTYPEIYGPITENLVNGGHEVHIITGLLADEEVQWDLKNSGVIFTHWFSIAQYHIDLGEFEVVFDEAGKPWMDEEGWNRTKAEYCERESIDLLIDDSPVYGSYFRGKTLYLLQKNFEKQAAWLALAGRKHNDSTQMGKRPC